MEFESRMRVFIINFVIIFVLITSIYFTQQIHKDFLKEIFIFNFEHVFTFFIIFSLELIVLGMLLYKYFSNRRKRIADSSLLRYKDINREQKRARNSVFYPRNNRYYGKDKRAMSISRNVEITTKKSHEHIMLLGPTGSGKSASFFLPNLLKLDDVSIVVTDPKAELHRKSGPTLEKKGYKVIHLNFNNPDRSAFYSLLANAQNHDDVRKISDAILSNGEGQDEWGKLSKTLLEAFLFHEYDCGEKNISNVIKKMAEMDMKNEVAVEQFFQDSSEKAYLAFSQFKKTASGEGFVSSVYATIQGKMKVYEYDSVKKISTKNDFTPAIFRNQKTALFVSYNEDDSSVYSAFLAAFYYQLFSQIKRDKSVDEAFGDATGLPVYFLLDEFANVGKIPDLDVLLSTIRSKKMSMVLGVQSFDQLKKNYKDTFNIIAENCKTKIVLGGATGESAEVFSKLIGEEEYTNMSVSQGDKSLSTSTSINKKRIMSADQIRLLKTFELVCISDNLKPFLDDRKYYFFDNISYFLYKKLPFDIQRNDEIIKKYNAWKNKKQTQEVIQEKKIHIYHERQEVNEEKVMIRQEKVQERTLTKQEEIRIMREQHRKRDLD
ncbi:hypothetical protein BCM0100_p208 (plasmid) [Bacillus cereus]|uniref:type IV secretory system conjugative DNA transfer family protein n=1 Tax=Bacillus cereus TaxID=1396 RepID=UPI001EED9BF6|nr:type IV secretory system conjugative DNA transfer family protein [Bacillus cereus]BCC32955.1 hypothetical protein BCM0100_p208 [Bacillus cereus]